MFFRRRRARRDPLKHIKPIKRMTVDGVKLKRRRYKEPKPPKRKLRLSYRIAIPVIFLFLGTYFAFFGRWSFYRLAYSLYDLLLALAEYLLKAAQLKTDFLPIRINEIPDVPYVPFLPFDTAELKGFWQRFFTRLFDGENFLFYNLRVLLLVLSLNVLILPCIILYFIFSWLFRRSARVENDDFGKETRAVRLCRRIGAKLSRPLGWCVGLWYTASTWIIVLAFILVLAGTNIATVAIEAVAALLHVSVSADYVHLYVQLYKLLLDLTIMFDTLPLPIWLLIGYQLTRIFRRMKAFDRLEETEIAVREVVSRLPLLVLITGKVGVGKTQANACLTLSCQDAHRDRMKESMMEIRAEFPEYPWAMLDRQLGVMYLCGDLKGKSATRRLISSLLSEDDDLFYGYRGTRTFSDGVTVSHLRDRIIDYAELQYMYRVQCLIFSSYSLRVDATYTDKGKLPAWSTDYFHSPAFDPWQEAERAHVSDFDLLRLGKPVDKSSPSGAWEFGIWSHTEMGKDFGNALTNRNLKADAPTSNILNDMLVDRLKIKRHSATACYVPYAQYIGDEQRPSSLQADVLELTDVLQIKGSSGARSTYHLFLFERFLRDFLLSLWHGWYAERCVNRADVDLIAFTLQKLMARYNPRIRCHAQLFGYEVLDVALRDGSDMNAEPEILKLPIAYKKCRAGRYATDCYADVLADRAAASEWEHDLAPTYSGPVANADETKAQHSRFGDKLLRVRRKDHYED